MDKITKTEAEWKAQLTPEQYQVTRKHGTERAFTGEYHATKDKGTYMCVGCGLPLFSSETKFDSGVAMPELARRHQRTQSSIRLRLEKLGKIEAAAVN